MKDFLNAPLFQIGEYVLYPALVGGVMVLILIALVLIAMLKTKSKIPREVKPVKERKNEKVIKESFKYNTISSWQREHIGAMLEDEISFYKKENNEEYISVLEEIKMFIDEKSNWSVQELLSINPDSISMLNSMIADEMEYELYENNNLDRVVLYANTLDRVNGGLDSDCSSGFLNHTSEGIRSNLEDSSNDGKRLIGCIVEACDFLENYMEDGVLPDEIDFIDYDMQMMNDDDLANIRSEVLEVTSIDRLRQSTMINVVKILFFRLRTQIENSIDSASSRIISGNSFNNLRAIVSVVDGQMYTESINEFLD